MLLLASYPRSGSAYLRHVLSHCFGMHSASAHRNEAQPPGCEIGPPFVKTHETAAARLSNYAIHLVRNPFDAIASHARLEMAMGYGFVESWDFDETVARLINGSCWAFGQQWRWNWGEHSEAWSSRDELTVRVRFEQLIEDPIGIVGEALELLNIGREPIRDPMHLDDLRRDAPIHFSSERAEISDGAREKIVDKWGGVITSLGYKMEPATC